MTPRRLKLLAWLLPLFIARSLLPIGFMLTFDASGAHIVFCPSVISAPLEPSSAHGQSHHDSDSHAAHAHHDHGGHHAHHHGGSDSSSAEQSHQTCPFAFAAAAPLASLDHFAVTPRPSEAITDPIEAAIVTLASRAHPIRGPPALS